MIEWGAIGGRFEHEIGQVAKDLESTDYKAFHRGLKFLGEMLGFHTELPEGDGAPDCVWSIGNRLYVIHEAKSGQTPDGIIGVNDVRQAQGHENWLRANRPCAEDARVLCLLESPRGRVASEAVPHASSVYHVFPVEIKELFDEVAGMLRRVRSKVIDLSDEKALEELFREIKSTNLKPVKVMERLSQRPLTTMAET